MEEMCLLCRFVRDAGEGDGFCVVGPPKAPLNQLGGFGAGGLVVFVENSIETGLFIKPRIHVGEEGGHRSWRLFWI